MNTRNLRTALLVIGIPVVYALLLRLFFGIHTWADIFKVMSLSFLVCLPFIVGALTIYFSAIEKVRKWAYRLFIPWIPIFIFFGITLAFQIEGWACWLMVLPLFLVAASVGGLIGGYLKLKKRDDRTYLSLLCLLPLFISPIESFIGSIPGTYKAYTFIDINAPAEKIWANVTRVLEIQEEQDKGWLTKFLGFPRPLHAELDFEGIGAKREARFTNGLIFHETVSEYTHLKKMVFSIKAYPHEIPSTTMDEHVVIGGQFFDVLKGTYELEKINETTNRLHLYSHFTLNTTLNFYASWWARWIMQDIQNNILQIEKKRSEQE
ncbi:MAG: hypothetical protein IPK62_06725 [Bacteroidetes bacterium]|nr:hypothetical protein [Bacteroidota bacterium]